MSDTAAMFFGVSTLAVAILGLAWYLLTEGKRHERAMKADEDAMAFLASEAERVQANKKAPPPK